MSIFDYFLVVIALAIIMFQFYTMFSKMLGRWIARKRDEQTVEVEAPTLARQTELPKKPFKQPVIKNLPRKLVRYSNRIFKNRNCN